MHKPLLIAAALLLSACASSGARKPSQSAEIHFLAASAQGEAPTAGRYPGERVVVKITGLESGATYLLRNSMASPGFATLESSVQAVADQDGVISTSTAQPLKGTYSKADADGIFWSMQAIRPLKGAQPQGYNFTVEQAGRALATAVLPMQGIKPGTKMIDVASAGLVGKLFIPANAEGRLRAVITFGGSEGGLMTGLSNASALANEGFAALGLAYFGTKGVPADLKEIPLEYFEKAIRFLRARPDIGDIAVMGSSRGGELALLLGATYPELRAVVAQVPSPVRWSAVSGFDFRGKAPSAWTYRGHPLSFADDVGGLVRVTLPDGRKAYSNRPAFEKALANTASINAATTAVEKINGPVLLLGAEDDQVWPSCTFTKMALTRLQENKHAFPDEMECYPNAGHTMTAPPFMPTQDTASMNASMHALLSMGGTPEGNAAAQRQSWTKTLQFLRQNLNR